MMNGGVDLRTEYLGLDLRSPVIASASPLSREIEGIRALERAGAGAVVLYSLFQEQIASRRPRWGDRPWDALHDQSVTVDPREFTRKPELYVDHVASAKRAVDIPIIASLNVHTPDRWTEHARLIEQAGADALELDIYSIETDLEVTSEQMEQTYVDVVCAARAAVGIPIAVKLAPYVSALGRFAVRLVEAGADGLVLFNRLYQPTIDVEARRLVMRPTLSTSADALIAMTWIALLHRRVPSSFAATGGVHTATDAIRMVMAGADVVMMCSALLKEGPEALARVRRELVAWLVEHDLHSLESIRGCMSLAESTEPEDLRRAGYAKILNRYS